MQAYVGTDAKTEGKLPRGRHRKSLSRINHRVGIDDWTNNLLDRDVWEYGHARDIREACFWNLNAADGATVEDLKVSWLTNVRRREMHQDSDCLPRL